MNPGKVVLVVLDGLGVGALPDASAYGDAGANTLGNTARAVGGLCLPNLQKLGLGNLTEIMGVPRTANATGCFGRMAEASAGKDSTTGHWELAGIITSKPFPLYANGFPEEVLQLFLTKTACSGYLGNKPASGTEIIKELGAEHLRTGFPIVYTSGDSVFQIAAHEEVFPLPRLYEICEVTRREVMVDSHAVGRIIARPFIGVEGGFVRTTNRKDFALEPPGEILHDLLLRNGVETVGVGKIDDLYCGRGLGEKIHTVSNREGIHSTIESMRRLKTGFIMTNLVDFDMAFGHRQDARGMATSLEEFDATLPTFLGSLNDGDVLILTADHGNDPTDQSTDHTREYVPLLCVKGGGHGGANLGVRPTFSDAAKTVAEYFAVPGREQFPGNSFLASLV